MDENQTNLGDDILETPGVQVAQTIVEEFPEAEWVFQFDEDEPIVFAWTNGESDDPPEVVIKLKANSQSNILFASADMSKKMKIFCRRMTDETRNRLEKNS